MMAKPTAIYIDLDGTLIDPNHRYYQASVIALEKTSVYCRANRDEFKAKPIPQADFLDLKRNKVPDLEIAMRLGLTRHQAELYLSYVAQIVNSPLLENYDQPIAQVDQALGHLKRHGAKLSLLTLRSQSQAEQILKQNGWSMVFDSIYGLPDNSELTGSKIQLKTTLLREAIRLQNQSASEEDWVIGDTEADVMAGKQLNLQTIALTSGIRSYCHLEQMNPNFICSNLFEAALLITRSTSLLGRYRSDRDNQEPIVLNSKHYKTDRFLSVKG